MTLESRSRKKIVVSVAIFGALLVVEVTTYLKSAESMMPVAGLGGGRLPGHLTFVAVLDETWNSISEKQKDALMLVLKKSVQQIYTSPSEVPNLDKSFWPVTGEDYQTYDRLKARSDVSPSVLRQLKRELDEGRKLVGYKNGVSLGWKLQSRGLFWMKCEASLWISNTGGGHSSDLFVWVLGRWVRVYNFHRAVS